MQKLMKDHVRELRRNSTDAEKRLWHFLRAKRLKGYKFRRQHLVHPFIVDFICPLKSLIIELDGGQHADQCQYDEKRTQFLQSKGYKLLRFWNNEVLEETEAVLEGILHALKKDNLNLLPPDPFLLQKAGREVDRLHTHLP